MISGFEVVPVRKIAARKTASWDTREVDLQFSNDYRLYSMTHGESTRAYTHGPGGTYDAQDVKDIWSGYNPNPSVDVHLVDWDAVADAVNDDIAEEKGFTASRKTAGPEDYQNGGYRGYDPDGDDRSPEQHGRAAIPHHIYEQSSSHPGCRHCGLDASDHDEVPDWGGYKTSSLTVTAKEVGYYVVSRNGVPISGPYATRSDAAPNMIEQRGAAVMFIGPGNSAEWDALKPKQFPAWYNTVNG
jgi:hypothetical protein